MIRICPQDAAGVTNATPGGRGKNHKVSASNRSSQRSGRAGHATTEWRSEGAPRNLSKHAQGGHHSTGPVTNQPPASPSTDRHKSTRSMSTTPKAHLPNRTTLRSPSNGQKHQQKHAPQSAPSLAKQSKPSQPPPAAAHHDQHSQRTAAAAHQNTAPQPSNAPHGKGKGKGGGEKKPNEKKNKGRQLSL